MSGTALQILFKPEVGERLTWLVDRDCGIIKV